MENLEKISEEFSFDKEKEIARSFSKRFQWFCEKYVLRVFRVFDVPPAVSPNSGTDIAVFL